MAGELTHEGRIGRYRRIALLGEGGMGVVYRGTDPAGRDVAIKVFGAGIAGIPGDAAGLRRLAGEIELMRRVLSPHVADVLDGDVTADHPFVVTRFVPGRPLDDVVGEHGPLRGGALRRLALGLAKALAAIHEAGTVHRDLRPGNVLMVGGEPVVIDFGIARAVDDQATSAADVRAWAATVAFAATGASDDLDGVPEPLRPILRSALTGDAAVRPAAADLVDAVSALDLGPDEAPRPGPVPQPRAEAAFLAAPQPRPGPGARAAARTAPAAALALGPAWSRLFAVLAVVIVIGVAIMMPIAGIVLATGGVFALRLADTAGGGTPDPAAAARALARTALTLPYAAIFTLAATLGLVSLVTLGAHTDSLTACAWGAGAGAAALWAGPGVRAPRRQLERLFGAIATEPRGIALVGVGLGVLAFLAVVGAVSLTPSFAPMYGLQSSLVNSLDRFQNALP